MRTMIVCFYGNTRDISLDIMGIIGISSFLAISMGLPGLPRRKFRGILARDARPYVFLVAMEKGTSEITRIDVIYTEDVYIYVNVLYMIYGRQLFNCNMYVCTNVWHTDFFLQYL